MKRENNDMATKYSFLNMRALMSGALSRKWIAIFGISIVLLFGAMLSFSHAQTTSGSCTEQNLSVCSVDQLNALMITINGALEQEKASPGFKNLSSSDQNAIIAKFQKRIDAVNNAITALNQQANNNTASNNTKSSGSAVSGAFTVPLPYIGLILQFILYIALLCVSGLISLVGWLAQEALSFNAGILNFNPPFVITGWTIFRDIANLGFVLGIIIIAVATILRSGKYRMEALLWKIIVAALLVNFSLLIAGIFIKITNSISAWLLAYISGSSGDVGAGAVARIGDSFGFYNIISKSGFSPTAGLSIWSLFGGANLGTIVAMIVTLIVGVVILLTLLAFAGMLFMRYFYLSFLLIISPAVWLLWVFPTTKKYWDQWWDTFIHWSIYAPLILLFVYLSVSVMNQFANQNEALNQLSQSSGVAFPFGAIMTSLIAAALLIGGLKIAQKMGHGGTKMALGFATKTGNWMKTQAQTKAKWGANRVGSLALKSKTGQSVQNRLTKWGTAKPFKERSFLQKYNPLNAGTEFVARGLSKQMAVKTADMQQKADKGSQALVDDAKKQFDNLSDEQLKKLIPTFNKSEKIAAYEMLAKKNKLDKTNITNEDLADTLTLMKSMGRFKEMGDIEKKMGRNLNMARILSGQNALDGNGHEDASITFEKEAGEFFKKFSEVDWKNIAQNIGKTVFSINEGTGDFDKTLPGMTEETTGELRKSYLQAIGKDMGKAIHSTVSKLQDQGEETVVNLFASLADGVKNEIESEHKGSLEEAIGNKDVDAISDILQKSSKPNISRLGKKIDKSMSSALGGSYTGDEGGGEKKDGGDKK